VTDVALFALGLDPGAVVVQADRGAFEGDAQVVGQEEQILDHGRGLGGLGYADQDAERQGVVDDRLAHVQDVDVVFGQLGGEGRGQAGAVGAGDVNEQYFTHGLGHVLGMVLARARLARAAYFS